MHCLGHLLISAPWRKVAGREVSMTLVQYCHTK
jgi:hypothetical protein